MVDFKELRKKIEAYEAEDSKTDGEVDSSEESTNLAGFIAPIPGWKTELNDFYVSAPLSIGSGSFLFGWGSGKLSRGTVAQAEGQYHQKILNEAEGKIKEAEEAQEAEEQKNQTVSYNVLTDPSAFKLAPSYGSLNTFGGYGSAVGQSQLSFQFIG